MTPGTRNDGLRLQLAASDVASLRAVGTLAGVVILAVAARNGPGQGILIASAAGISWQAPHGLAGAPQPITADGSYLLEDGADPSRWIRIQAYAAYLPQSGNALVSLGDQYAGVGIDDVSAANATAGIIETTQFSIKNMTANAITGVTLWIDATGNGYGTVSISSDGANFFKPLSQGDPNVLTWASIAPAASANLWVKRTIGAGAASNAGLLNLLQYAWNGV